MPCICPALVSALMWLWTMWTPLSPFPLVSACVSGAESLPSVPRVPFPTCSPLEHTGVSHSLKFEVWIQSIIADMALALQSGHL